MDSSFVSDTQTQVTLDIDESVCEEHSAKKRRTSINSQEDDNQPSNAVDKQHPYAHLPITEVPGLHPNLLEKKNRFSAFDDHVHFDEPTHVYTVDGVRYRGSCTAFLGQWFGKFDADAVSDKIVGSWKWKNKKDYRYYQMTKDEIKENWSMANKLGTRMHYCAELLMNGIEVPNHPDFQTVEFAHHFRNFWRDHVVGKLRPWRSEWIVFHRVYEIIGSVDGILQRVDSEDPYELILYDWKRCIKIEQEAYQNETATGPFAGLPKANFWKYSLQLNTYKFIIEQGSPYRVSDMFLLRCHPDSPNYERIKVPDMQHYVRKAVAVRFERLMETDLTTLARALKTSSYDERKEKQEEEEQEEGEVGLCALPESSLDPPALALQILQRYKAHTRELTKHETCCTDSNVDINNNSCCSDVKSSFMSTSTQDVRHTYKFDDA